MTEDDGFLHRWSRRKRDSERDEETPKEAAAADDAHAACSAEAPDAAADLPPTSTLDADSDYTAFLKAGVPAALRHAALRRAWAVNGAIAGHKPLVDYDWDFNAPGYGALRPTDDPMKIAGDLFRRLFERRASLPEESDRSSPSEVVAQEESPAAEPEAVAVAVAVSSGPDAPESSASASDLLVRRAYLRRHGGATPT